MLDTKVNNGFGYGHNAVLDKINSKYHFVVNPDIEVEGEEEIEKMVKYLDENQDIGMITPLNISPDLTIYSRKYSSR